MTSTFSGFYFLAVLLQSEGQANVSRNGPQSQKLIVDPLVNLLFRNPGPRVVSRRCNKFKLEWHVYSFCMYDTTRPGVVHWLDNQLMRMSFERPIA